MSTDRRPGRGNLASIAKVFSGAVAGQAILAGCSPLLTRLYSPTEIGAYGLCLSLSLILAPLTSLRIEYAIPIARRDVEARAVLFTAMFCNVTFLIVATLLLSAIVPFVKLTSRIQSFVDVRYYVLFSTCFLSIFESFRFYCVRNREYALVGKMLVARSIWQAGIQLGAPYAGLGGQGMLVGYVVGQFLGTRRLLKALLSSAKGTEHRFFSRRYISRVVWRHRRFPFMMMPSNLINSIGFYMPNVLVTYYYGIEAGGFYTLAQRLLGVPMTLIGRSIGDVFLGEFSRLTRVDKRAAWRLFITMLVRLIAIGAFCMILLFAVQPEWCVAIFGTKWGNVAHILKILSACYVGQLIVAPLAQSMIVLHRQRTLLIWDMCRTPVLLACIVLIARYGGSVNLALLSYSSITGAFYVLLLWLIVVTLRHELLDPNPGGSQDLVPSSSDG
jgi:O-antigen/teichoic acid export membrane protein